MSSLKALSLSPSAISAKKPKLLSPLLDPADSFFPLLPLLSPLSPVPLPSVRK